MSNGPSKYERGKLLYTEEDYCSIWPVIVYLDLQWFAWVSSGDSRPRHPLPPGSLSVEMLGIEVVAFCMCFNMELRPFQMEAIMLEGIANRSVYIFLC